MKNKEVLIWVKENRIFFKSERRSESEWDILWEEDIRNIKEQACRCGAETAVWDTRSGLAKLQITMEWINEWMSFEILMKCSITVISISYKFYRFAES